MSKQYNLLDHLPSPPRPPLSEESAMEYELGSVSLLGSFWYRWFPNRFLRRFARRYDRYIQYRVWKVKTEINNQTPSPDA